MLPTYSRDVVTNDLTPLLMHWSATIMGVKARPLNNGDSPQPWGVLQHQIPKRLTAPMAMTGYHGKQVS